MRRQNDRTDQAALNTSGLARPNRFRSGRAACRIWHVGAENQFAGDRAPFDPSLAVPSVCEFSEKQYFKRVGR
jgi:hypothetical protein